METGSASTGCSGALHKCSSLCTDHPILKGVLWHLKYICCVWMIFIRNRVLLFKKDLWAARFTLSAHVIPVCVRRCWFTTHRTVSDMTGHRRQLNTGETDGEECTTNCNLSIEVHSRSPTDCKSYRSPVCKTSVWLRRSLQSMFTSYGSGFSSRNRHIVWWSQLVTNDP